MEALTIGRAARNAGVHVETIRFYERQGIIKQPPKPNGTGVRVYGDETIARIRFVREAQQLGFSLREIRELLALRANPAADCSNVRDKATAKLHDVQRKIERLRQIGAALEALIVACPARGSLQACSIIDALELRSVIKRPQRISAVTKSGAKQRRAK
ncbi:MAG: MerR family transcriptional regulator [Candidatus Acidiferrales bacterium]